MKQCMLILILCAIFEAVVAQDLDKPDQIEDNHKGFYIDASAGYFPHKRNASWAGQVSGGYCFNDQSAIGFGMGVWGRDNIYQRYGMGTGIQYRHNFPARLFLKGELGYMFLHKMYDKVLGNEMIYLSENSKPYYANISAHWRFWRNCVIGIAATQSGSLYFNRFVKENQTTKDLWRINAFTIQLGVFFDGNVGNN